MQPLACYHIRFGRLFISYLKPQISWVSISLLLATYFNVAEMSMCRYCATSKPSEFQTESPSAWYFLRHYEHTTPVSSTTWSYDFGFQHIYHTPLNLCTPSDALDSHTGIGRSIPVFRNLNAQSFARLRRFGLRDLDNTCSYILSISSIGPFSVGSTPMWSTPMCIMGELLIFGSKVLLPLDSVHAVATIHHSTHSHSTLYSCRIGLR